MSRYNVSPGDPTSHSGGLLLTRAPAAAHRGCQVGRPQRYGRPQIAPHTVPTGSGGGQDPRHADSTAPASECRRGPASAGGSGRPPARAACPAFRPAPSSVDQPPRSCTVSGWRRAAPLDVTVSPLARRRRRTRPDRSGPWSPPIVAPWRPTETTVVAGLPVTTLPRTWSTWRQCCRPRRPGRRGGLRAADRGGHPGRARRGLADRGRTTRVRVLRRALPLLDARSRSRPESHARVVLVTRRPAGAGGQPARSTTSTAVARRAGPVVPEARVALEYQGADHAELGRMRRDVARHMDLHRAGWQVLYYTAEDVFGRPDGAARRHPGRVAPPGTAAARSAPRGSVSSAGSRVRSSDRE